MKMSKTKNLIILIIAIMIDVNAFSRSRPHDLRVKKLIKNYRLGKVPEKQLWNQLVVMSNKSSKLSRDSLVSVLQLKAKIIYQDGYPITAAIWAAKAIETAHNPIHKNLSGSWKILSDVSKARPIQYMLEALAASLRLKKNPPWFGNAWNYIRANSLAVDNKKRQAIKYYRMAKMGERYFLSSQYQLAMNLVEIGRTKEAKTPLKSIISGSVRQASPIKSSDKVEMWNYAHIALARIYYEEQDFLTAARLYRKVTRSSPLFYDALFEQSWALFMGGNPTHALGSLTGAHSPYFAHEFNAEGRILEATIYFWLCRYEDSRMALVQFSKEYSKPVENLSVFLDKKHLSPDRAYRLFEDLVMGVSSESLGLPRRLLESVANQDSMLLVRDQLASLLHEHSKISWSGILGQSIGKKTIIFHQDKIINHLKKSIGNQFLTELDHLRKHYDDLEDQSEFLYLELLMSEKEQLLGKELHASSKVTRIDKNRLIRGWGKRLQSWSSDRKGEFWWDEIGYQIVPVKPQCVN